MHTQDATSASSVQIKLSELIVNPENNPRGEVKPDSLDGLVNSIKQEGLLQPLLAKQDGDSIVLVAGYRRAAAAEIAGLDQVPVYVRSVADSEGAAFDENAQRQAMTPMAEALSLARQKKDLGSAKKVASARGMKAPQVTILVKMTELPESVQKIAMTSDLIGPAVARPLVAIAKIPGGEPVAVKLATLAAEDRDYARDLAHHPFNCLGKLSRNAESDDPFVVSARLVNLNGLGDGTHAERFAAIRKSLTFAQEHALRLDNYRPEGVVTLDEATVDAIRAAGALYEETDDRYMPERYVFDKELLVDQLDQMIGRYEKEVEEANAAEVKQTKEGKPPEKSKHQLRIERQAAARSANEKIGEKLVAQGAKKPTKARTLKTAKLVALMLVTADRDLFETGNRICFPGWKEVEQIPLKKGGTKEKVTYLDPSEALNRLTDAIEKAKSVEEVLSLTLDATITGAYGDQDELTQKERVKEFSRSLGMTTRPLLADLAKGIVEAKS